MKKKRQILTIFLLIASIIALPNCASHKQNKKIQKTLVLLLSEEICTENSTTPLNKINGQNNNSLKDLLVAHWNKNSPSNIDSTLLQTKKEINNVMSYVLDQAVSKNERTIISLTLRVTDNNGQEFGTLIFCIEEIKELLLSNWVYYNEKKINILDYLNTATFERVKLYESYLKSGKYPCYN